MQPVVTEELRNRGGIGRELVETEEDVAAVHDVIQLEKRMGTMSVATASVSRYVPAPRSPSPPREMPPSKLLIAQQEAAAVGLRPIRTRVPQPTAQEFLARPYYPNRYLFSFKGDADGVYCNPGGRWEYAIPLPGSAGPSSGSDDGRYFGQLARLSFPGSSSGDSGRGARGGASAYVDPLC